MSVNVEVVYARPERQWSVQLDLETGATAEQAAKKARECEPMCLIQSWYVAAYGVWGEEVSATYVLEDGDRLELLRPLVVDPMEARRRRAQKQNP